MAASKPDRKEWRQTAGSFQHFLAWLDEGTDSGGQRYLDMRRRLVAYFDRKRAQSPDELADETLNRVARRLEEEGDITDTPPARYCYIVARFVLLEYARWRKHGESSLDDTAIPSAPGSDAGTEERERLLVCLDRCLQGLDAAERAIILDYYRGEQGVKLEYRRHIAARLNITANALSIRACRIRRKLEACVSACSAGR